MSRLGGHFSRPGLIGAGSSPQHNSAHLRTHIQLAPLELARDQERADSKAEEVADLERKT